MRRTGFTLIELLTVITIIVILMGMLFPIIGLVRQQMKKTKTRTTISEIVAACSQYHTICGSYPDSQPNATGLPDIQSTLMNGATPKTLDQVTSDNWNTVSTALLTLLQTVDRDHFSGARWPSNVITDAWNGTLRYRPVRYYPYSNNPPHLIDGTPPPNQDSYQLWSPGPDGKDAPGEPNSDDLTNWQQ
jgi:prepilin-type N-terminal cleavage/methylation domain-containing protein